MKPPLFVPIHRGAIPVVSGLGKRFALFLTMAGIAGWGSGLAFAQGPGTAPGNFYQATPPGSGITGATYNELAYVNGFLPANVSLYNPVPSGDTAATASQLAAAVSAATNNLLSASPSPAVPAGVTVASIATQIVANNPTAATGSTGTLAALANSIIANQSAANAYTSLTSVVSGLATAYPSTVSTLAAPIFTSAAASATEKSYLPQLTLAATTATTAVSSNDQTVGAIVSQAITAAATSASPQQSLMQNIVATEYGSSLVNGSQASIAAISKGMLNGSAVAVISGANMVSYLQSAVNALPAGSQTNVNAGAIFLGMVASGSLPESLITSDLSTASSATASQQAYLAAMNTGYNSTASNVAANIAANPGAVDAVLAGAVSSGVVAQSTLVTDALGASGSTPIQNIVAAAMTADLITNAADNSPTIAATAVGAVSPSSFLAVAQGAVGGGRSTEAGTITAALIKGSPGYSATYSTLNTSTFTATNVQNLVAGALTGAYGGAYGTSDVNSKPGAIAQIVYQSELAASNFGGATAAQYSALLPLAEAVATQAITTMKALDTLDADIPTYIAAAAAFAGYGGPATNLPSIQSSINSGAIGADSSANALAAINAVEPVVQNYKTLSSTGYTQTLSALGSNSTASDSVIAILYGASLSNPVDSSALLAAAVAKVPGSTVTDANLLAAAIYANPLNQANLTIANTVAVHLESNLATNVSDIANYVGYQVAQNPTYVKDIAAAAVAVDPNQANYVARAVAFNNPATGYTAIPSIFAYSQLTSKYNNTNSSAHIDEASAAAAISAGYAAGIVQAAQSTTTTSTVVEQALVNGVSQAVGSAISQNNTRLTGASFPQAPTSLSTLPGSPTITVNGAGVPTYSGTISSSPAVGAAGVVTGMIAQVVSPGDTTIGSATGAGSNAGTVLNTSSPSTASQIVNAILKATVFIVQNGLPTTTLNGTNNGYVTEIAQAAGQAFGYITGGGTSNLTTAQEVSAADNIAADLTTSTSASNYKLVLFAAYYGITQGQSGYLGAGSTGISAKGPYSQNGSTVGNAVTGAPVTDIFNL
jgi:hypothetical protein